MFFSKDFCILMPAYRQSIAGYLDIGILLATDISVLSFLTCRISLQVVITSNRFFSYFFVCNLSRVYVLPLWLWKKYFQLLIQDYNFFFHCIFFFIFINSNIKNLCISLDNRILNLQILRKKFKQWFLQKIACF